MIKCGQKIVSKEYSFRRSLLDQAFGLMFSPPKDLIFEFKNLRQVSIHGWFCFYSIDLLFLDSKKKIVEKYRLRPFSFYRPRHKFKYLVELAPVRKTPKVGKKLVF